MSDPLMDPTEILSPVLVERRIREISNRIATGVRVVSNAQRELKSAQKKLREAYAAAYLGDGSAPGHARRYVADLATVAERDAVDVAQVAYNYARDLARALEKELAAMQSVGVSVRQMYGVVGRGES